MLAEILQTDNSLNSEETLRIPLPHSDNSPMLHPGGDFELSLELHAGSVGEQELCLLFVYREVCVLA
jgi:trafficking protein particle complex subunit 8